MLPILYVFLLIILLFLYIYLTTPTKRKIPSNAKEAPQEEGLPFVGMLHKIVPPMNEYLLKLGKKHGSIFRIKMGMREVFVLNDYTALKMCLKEDSENFSGRWNGKYIRMVMEDSGILMIDGEVWAQHRSFMLRILRDFGLGSSRTDEIVQIECKELLAEIEQKEKQNIDFLEMITIKTVNIISEFLMKKRYTKEDEDVNLIINFIKKIMSKRNLLQIVHIMFPLWDNSNICSKISYKFFFNGNEFRKITNIFKKEIKEHLLTLNMKSEGEDFMDRFLIEQNRLNEKNDSTNTFTEVQLVRSSFEMFAAGFDTTSWTLVWSFVFLSKYQDAQNRMHLEISDLLGKDKMPSSVDKKSLPYTQAVMDEILRLSSVAPLAVFHRNFHDTVINGIFIPKNSFILPNLYACHRDENVWEKPYEFYPEHFLITSSENIKYRPRNELNPFSMGKRQCLGESLARAEFFIFLASIIQKYKVNFADEITDEIYQETLRGDKGQARYSKIKNFRFESYSHKDS